MATDTERREMARRLREHRGISRDMKCMLEECLFGPGVLCLDVDGSCASCRDRIIDRLADLIEPHRGFGGRTILCAHCESASWCGCEPGDEEGGCDFEPSVTEGEPPYNLYSLYEAVFRRHPRDEYAIDDDEVEEMVDALLDICNAPGHESIQRAQPITGDTSDGYHTFNELYDHRAKLFSVIVRCFKDRAWKSKLHHDGTMYEGMFIVGIETSQGQATYHYDVDPYWGIFDCEELGRAPEWDGHTPQQAIDRIAALRPACDRDALLALADGLEEGDVTYLVSTQYVLDSYASRIREALGVES